MSDNAPTPPNRKPRAFTIEEPQPKAERAGSSASKAAKPKPQADALADALADPITNPQTARKTRKPTSLPVTIEMSKPADDPFSGASEGIEALTPPPAEPRARRITPAKILLSALSFLIALAVGIWVDTLIRELFDRLPWLGWGAAAAVAIALLALTFIIAREISGLRRLSKVADLRSDIAASAHSANAKKARALAARVTRLIAANPLSARGRKNLEALEGEIIDGPHYLDFAERELMADLDKQARRLTLNAARRVSVVTAVSPRAFVDLAYVLYEAVRLVRAMAELYGGRPGTIGMIRLFRDVIAHLAVTGAVAAGDSLLQQVVGHGLAAKLSARLGEGVINGLMTARIGISAMDLCRPMPFKALKRPGIGDFISDLASFTGKKTEAEKSENGA